MKIKLFLFLIIVSQNIFASMMYIPRTNVDVEKIIEHLKLKPNDTSFILNVFHKTAKFKTIIVKGDASDPISVLAEKLTSYKITRSFQQFIFKDQSWLSKSTEKNIELISKNKDRIKNILGENSYVWAWFLMQLGSTEKSIKLLSTIFDDEYIKVMSLKRAHYGRGSNPLGGISNIYETLVMISKNKKKIKEKMRILKTHLSNLPQSHIQT